MRIYSISALLKVFIGIAILGILYNYINVYQDPMIGLSFGFLGVFMIVWGASYYFFLAGYKIFNSNLPYHQQSSLSYKLSLLLGMFVMSNITLMVTDAWNKWIAFLLIALFIVLQVIITYGSRNYSN